MKLVKSFVDEVNRPMIELQDGRKFAVAPPQESSVEAERVAEFRALLIDLQLQTLMQLERIAKGIHG